MTPTPLWTRARLVRVLRVVAGSRAGRVDTRAVADLMGVSQRTVQRWLHASSGRAKAKIPAARLQQLIALTMPTDLVLDQERGGAIYALEAIEALRLPREMGVKPEWKTQHWLEPHLVLVLEVRLEDLRIRQLMVTRATGAALPQARKRGTITDLSTVPTKFHATLLTHRLLVERHPWRFKATRAQVRRGFSKAWFSDAPETHLGRDAAAVTDAPKAFFTETMMKLEEEARDAA